ncbi:MAG: hypothetical protein Q8K30_02500 [Candidatus Gracilibacteria bacterium]|nr:hypothetical protein [Candidatus Gracilibacteria bacterium]
MKYLALVIRLSVLAIGVYLMINNPGIQTLGFLSGLAFFLIGIFFTMISVAGHKSVKCPLLKCDGDECKVRK